MAILVRKKATALTTAERNKFLEAVVRLKNRISPGKTYSVYDQFTALHGAVMGVQAPGESSLVNMGHQNIGFLPWHREYLWRFEKALQAEVPGVTIPYWRWPDSQNGTKLFINAFLGPSRLASSSEGNITGFFSGLVPSLRPAWWPSTTFAWRVHPNLQAGFGDRLLRGSPVDDWPPTAATMTALENSNDRPGGANAYWVFRETLEAAPRMHNTGHVVIGGQMADAFSPNDPLFWLHHSYIDREWAVWQAKRLAAEPGTTRASHYPAPGEASPFGAGDVPQNGHRRDDMMWPWVGSAPGYATLAVPAAVRNMLINYTGEPARRVRDVFNHETMSATDGYRYA